MFYADDSADYIKALEYCFQHPEELPNIASSARAFIQNNFDRDVLAERLMSAYQKALTETPHE